MDKFPDIDIDNIFREGSEKHDFPFKESAWENMDILLDKERKKRQWKRWSLLLLLLISISGIGLVGYSKITPQKAINNSSTEDILIAKEKEIIAFTEHNTTNSEINKHSDSSVTVHELELQKSTETKKNNIVNNGINNVQNTLKKKDLVAINTTPKETITSSSTISTTIQDKNTTDLNATTEPTNATNKIQLNTVSTYNTETSTLVNLETETQRPILNTKAISLGLLKPLVWNNTYNKKELPILSFDTSNNNRFRVGFTLGREVSSVGMMNNSKKGYRVGIELAYQFTNRFQVSTGFIASEKKYETSGTNYQARVTRWVNDIVPEMVQGTCDIFEIPLDFTYYFKGYEASSFFISSGFSAYIMRKEWYDYEYQSGTNMNELPIYWTGKMNNNHIVTNFSIGYQRILNDKITIQFAPYTQIPLSGIGDGQVKLYTTGLQLKFLFGKK